MYNVYYIILEFLLSLLPSCLSSSLALGDHIGWCSWLGTCSCAYRLLNLFFRCYKISSSSCHTQAEQCHNLSKPSELMWRPPLCVCVTGLSISVTFRLCLRSATVTPSVPSMLSCATLMLSSATTCPSLLNTCSGPLFCVSTSISFVSAIVRLCLRSAWMVGCDCRQLNTWKLMRHPMRRLTRHPTF